MSRLDKDKFGNVLFLWLRPAGARACNNQYGRQLLLAGCGVCGQFPCKTVIFSRFCWMNKHFFPIENILVKTIKILMFSIKNMRDSVRFILAFLSTLQTFFFNFRQCIENGMQYTKTVFIGVACCAHVQSVDLSGFCPRQAPLT
jgi:hypothetical protein